MTTTQAKVDADEERTLDQLAATRGGKANATRRCAALKELLDEWDREAGPVGDESVAAAVARYEL